LLRDVSDSAEPALRADAARNRRLILDAAAEAFAEGGLDVGVAEIARRAGVGAGTLFRRFPSKDDLIFAIVEERIGDMVALGRAALAEPDAGKALREFMFGGAEMHTRDRGFFDAVVKRIASEPQLQDLRGEVVEVAGELLRRAQEAGTIRDDVSAEDLPLLMCAAASASAPIEAAYPDLWRRYLGLILDGLQPCAATPLESDAPRVDVVNETLAALGSAEPAPAKHSRTG
jgi:AcrR family transcriptional regulator